mgnify:CR=1 FL=1
MREFVSEMLRGILRKGLNNTYTYAVNYGTRLFKKNFRNIIKTLLLDGNESRAQIQIISTDQQVQVKIFVAKRHVFLFILVVGIYWVYHNRRPKKTRRVEEL